MGVMSKLTARGDEKVSWDPEDPKSVAEARGANWRNACKKLGLNPLTVRGKWQPGFSGISNE